MTTQHAPHPPSSPQPYFPEGAQKPRKQNNVIGLIALIVAVVGFVFACIPGALIIGWILLPIAFVLSLVGLFLPQKAKWSAITALIVSVVGTIVGVLVFFFVIVNAVDESFGGSESTVGDAAAIDEAADDAEATTMEHENAASSGENDSAMNDVGSRENPAALGTTVSGDDWEVTVVEFNPAADDEVLAANMFNEAAAEGNTYVVAEVETTYVGEGSDDPSWAIDVEYVSESGNVISSYDNDAVAPEPAMFDIGEMYTGASGTGNLVFEVPEDDNGLLRVSPGMIADPVFVSID